MTVKEYLELDTAFDTWAITYEILSEVEATPSNLLNFGQYLTEYAAHVKTLAILKQDNEHDPE